MFCINHIFEQTQTINLLILELVFYWLYYFLMLWILFCSIFYTSSCRQHHAAPHQYSSIFDFVSEIYSIKILIIDLTEFFCHACIQCFFPWQNKHTPRLSLSLSLYCNLFFLSLIFLSRFHCFSGIKNVWIIQLRASSVSKNCTCLLKMMTIQNGSRQILIPLPWVPGIDRQTLSQRSTCDVNWYQPWYRVFLFNTR